MLADKRKIHKLSQFQVNSPEQRNKIHRSAYLPYFKRFPNSKFLSQQKKRQNTRQRSQQTPHKKVTRFFNDRQYNFVNFSQSEPKNRQSFFNIKKHSKLKPRLLKQSFERQSNKIRRRTQQSPQNKYASGFVIEKKTQQLLINHNSIDSAHLSQYQKEQIKGFKEIYYYGQYCTKKISTEEQMNKPDGGYIWTKHDHIAYRYQILEQMGEGSFGQVFKCYDHLKRCQIAVKLVKNNEKYTKQAKSQIKILNYIKAKDPLSTKNCVEIIDYFMFRKRMCMSFDLLSINLYQLTKNNGYYGFPMDLIRRFALQILNAIFFLHKIKIIHADLKPQNILLKQANRSGLRIIDFGSSCFEDQTIYTYIQSRYYRAPQVILGMKYNRKIDIWSFGCIIAELHLGYPLFAGENQQEQISLLIQVLGKPPQYLMHNAKRWGVFFNHQNQLILNEKNIIPKSKSLAQALQKCDPKFIQFIQLCLQWDPQKRLQALQLLKIEWIIQQLPKDILEQHLKFVEQQEQKLSLENKKKKKQQSFSIREKHRLL